MPEPIYSQVAGRFDMVIDQNADNVIELTIYTDDDRTEPMDLSGMVATAAIKLNKWSPVLVEFDVDIAEPESGTIQLVLDYATSSTLTFTSKAYFDIILTDGDDVRTRIVEGSIQLSRGVTE